MSHVKQQQAPGGENSAGNVPFRSSHSVAPGAPRQTPATPSINLGGRLTPVNNVHGAADCGGANTNGRPVPSLTPVTLPAVAGQHVEKVYRNILPAVTASNVWTTVASPVKSEPSVVSGPIKHMSQPPMPSPQVPSLHCVNRPSSACGSPLHGQLGHMQMQHAGHNANGGTPSPRPSILQRRRGVLTPTPTKMLAGSSAPGPKGATAGGSARKLNFDNDTAGNDVQPSGGESRSPSESLADEQASNHSVVSDNSNSNASKVGNFIQSQNTASDAGVEASPRKRARKQQFDDSDQTSLVVMKERSPSPTQIQPQAIMRIQSNSAMPHSNNRAVAPCVTGRGGGVLTHPPMVVYGGGQRGNRGSHGSKRGRRPSNISQAQSRSLTRLPPGQSQLPASKTDLGTVPNASGADSLPPDAHNDADQPRSKTEPDCDNATNEDDRMSAVSSVRDGNRSHSRATSRSNSMTPPIVIRPPPNKRPRSTPSPEANLKAECSGLSDDSEKTTGKKEPLLRPRPRLLASYSLTWRPRKGHVKRPETVGEKGGAKKLEAHSADPGPIVSLFGAHCDATSAADRYQGVSAAALGKVANDAKCLQRFDDWRLVKAQHLAAESSCMESENSAHLTGLISAHFGGPVTAAELTAPSKNVNRELMLSSLQRLKRLAEEWAEAETKCQQIREHKKSAEAELKKYVSKRRN